MRGAAPQPAAQLYPQDVPACQTSFADCAGTTLNSSLKGPQPKGGRGLWLLHPRRGGGAASVNVSGEAEVHLPVAVDVNLNRHAVVRHRDVDLGDHHFGIGSLHASQQGHPAEPAASA